LRRMLWPGWFNLAM